MNNSYTKETLKAMHQNNKQRKGKASESTKSNKKQLQKLDIVDFEHPIFSSHNTNTQK